ncbi:hypothetical protein [Streptomyces sp. NPDC059639]|uniref:hypothetical protein n=1 Tax=Streptomyces sp. NPDC059639 TaxID=3346891 RepID=UPI0036B7DD19
MRPGRRLGIAIGEPAEDPRFPALAPYTPVSAEQVVAGRRELMAAAVDLAVLQGPGQ